MRDYSHGKARKETIKDYGNFRLMVDGKLKYLTGLGVADFGFTEHEIRGVMEFDSMTAAGLLLTTIDYVSVKRAHG